jgi:WD40 repeat protein
MLNLRTGTWKKSVEGRAIGSFGPPIGLTGLAFTTDGRSVISTGDDHRIVIWDASYHATIEEAFDDPAALDMFTPVLSPDGSMGSTIDVDGNIIAWDLKGDMRLGRSFVVGSSYPWFAISPDGGTLAIEHGDMGRPGRRSSIRLSDTSTMKHGIVIPYNRFGNPGLAFSPDGHTLAVCTFGGYVQLWDVRTGRPAGPPLQAPGVQKTWPWAAAFSPDGTLLATAGSAEDFTKGVVFLWDVATGQLEERLPMLDHVVGSVNFTPDASRLIATTGWENDSGGGIAVIWNIDESRVERTIPIDNTSAGPSDISNDGTTLATAGSSGKGLWDISTGAQVGPTFTGGQGNTVDLSPDGRTLVAADKGQVVIWDVDTGLVIGRPFQPAGPEAELAASFAPDGRRLFIVSDSGEAWVWDVDPASWGARACQIAGRNLTEAEWSVDLPDRPYQATCGP